TARREPGRRQPTTVRASASPVRVSDRVRRSECLCRLDFDVQVDVILQARLSGEHFVDYPEPPLHISMSSQSRWSVPAPASCLPARATRQATYADEDEPAVVIGGQESYGVVGGERDGDRGGGSPTEYQRRHSRRRQAGPSSGGA